jgi:hypothetical protein
MNKDEIRAAYESIEASQRLKEQLKITAWIVGPLVLGWLCSEYIIEFLINCNL